MKKGFTLIELLAVIVILAVIALIAVPIVLNVIDETKEETNEISMKKYGEAVEIAISRYKLKEKKYPSNFEELEKYLDYDGASVECKLQQLKSDKTFILAGCSVNGSKEKYIYGDIPPAVSFEEDSWETIVLNALKGNTSKYNVGATKTIALSSTDSNIQGTYTVRVANNSTPAQCNTDGFSQTACGFVIEFVDIITTHQMNSSVSNEGGWQESEMRKFVETEIYNAFPDIIKNNIKETKVITGYEQNKIENYTTTDKIYLLSITELYGESASSFDPASNKTRQLDYYKKENVTNTDNISKVIKKFKGSAIHWWLRNYNKSTFYTVFSYDGSLISFSPNVPYGVAPAFRLG